MSRDVRFKMSYRVDEVAELFDCCRETIEREIKRGRLPAFKVGRTVRVSSEEVESYREKNRLYGTL